jgi:hypothetical protein
MRRDGTAFVPRVRGSSESISRVGGATGINQERPKTMKENELMKSRKIIFGTVLSALVCFGLCQQAQSATDTPDPGSVSSSNTADGQGALGSHTTGLYNSAFGFLSVLSLSDANFDTGVGAGALLVDNGGTNTAVGAGALLTNSTGSDNDAVGAFALFNNTTGTFNNAFGHEALFTNVDGNQNNAFGDLAMFANTSGAANTAVGDDALFSCTTGSSNVAIGDEAGTNIITGDLNIYIGAGAQGPSDELRFIRIGDTSFTDYDCFIAGIFGRAIDAGTAAIVGIDADQKLGTVVVDANGTSVPFKPQAMLNESLKQQKRIAELEGTVARLAAMVKEQTAQIQKVSAQLEVNKPAPQVVANKP